ncbi:hypothetical protein B566_EDAN000942 [Ephemera danica]|nr:hypothetical protein B566_EDAN000942 [Ephemera danica]
MGGLVFLVRKVSGLPHEALGSDPGSTSSWRSTDTVLEEDDARSEDLDEDLDEDSVSTAAAGNVPATAAAGLLRRSGAIVAASAATAAGSSTTVAAGGVKATRRSVSSASSSSVCSSGSHSSVPGAPEDLGFTLGVTEATPYPCQFCAKAFPRLSYLKKHEQSKVLVSIMRKFMCALRKLSDFSLLLLGERERLHNGMHKHKRFALMLLLDTTCTDVLRNEFYDIHLRYMVIYCVRIGVHGHSRNQLWIQESHAEHMPFRCEFCARLFKHKRSRDRHVKLHTGDRKYRCTQCEAAFSRSDHLKIHMKTHDTQKPFQCSACNRGYNTAAALTSHSQTHKRPPSLPASLPPRSSPHQQTLSRSPPSAPTPTRRVLQQQQEASARGGGSPPSARSALNAAAMAAAALAHSAGLQFAAPTLACIYCTKDSFTSMESLQLHVQAMHGSILNGEIREYQPPSPAHHMTSQSAKHAAPSPTHQHEPFSCDFCTMKFDNMQGLQKHSLAVHAMPAPPAPTSLPLTCAQCPAQFSSPGQHAEHVAVYHTEQLKPTDLSNKKPAATNGKRADNKLPQNTLLCSQCNAPFPDFESFRTHLKTHLDAEQGKSTSSHSKRTMLNNNIVPHYQCTECEATFSTENALEIHSLGHFLTTTTEFTCQSCLKSFQRPDELQKHLMDIHAHHLYRCALCREIFDSRVGAQVHFAVKHSNETRVLRCVACGDNSVKFRTEMEFTLHVRVHHLTPAHLEAQSMRQVAKPDLNSSLPNQLRCLYCNEFYKSEAELQYHIVNFHQKLFRCKICDEAFHVEFLLDKHMESAHTTSAEKITNNIDSQIESNKHQNGEKELTESKKSINFSSSPLKQSKSPSNNTVVVSLVCAYCNENCKSRSELEAHMKSHHQNRTSNGTPHATNVTGIGRHKCNICDQVCPTSTLLAEHKLTTHCKVLHSDQCSICKSSLAGEEQFFAHMQKHCPNSVGNNENLTLPTACIICRQTVTSDAEVQLHAKFHLHQKLQEYCNNATKEGEFSLACKECTSRFDNVADLELHYANFHTNNTAFRMPKNRDSYECISCQISFATELEVRSHVESTHNSDDSQRCHLCQESFDTPLKLQCHLIEHTFAGCPTFACYLCGAVFTASAGLQRHMVSHGPNSKPYDCNKCHLKFYFRSELDNHAFTHDQKLDNNDLQLDSSLHKHKVKSEQETYHGENTFDEPKIKNENPDEEQQSEAISLTNRKRKSGTNDCPAENGIDSVMIENGDDLKRLKTEPIDEQN